MRNHVLANRELGMMLRDRETEKFYGRYPAEIIEDEAARNERNRLMVTKALKASKNASKVNS